MPVGVEHGRLLTKAVNIDEALAVRFRERSQVGQAL